MKFARYLEDTQTPEWKRAYIDYRGLKKRITKIRIECENEDNADINASPTTSRIEEDAGGPSSSAARSSEGHSPRVSIDSASKLRSRTVPTIQRSEQPELVKRPVPKRSLTFRFKATRRAGTRFHNRSNTSHQETIPLNTLLTLLTPEQAKFFNYLDTQLEKIESFYVSREKELLERTTVLQQQLDELRQHRETFHKAQAKTAREWVRFKHDPLAAIIPDSMKGKGKRAASSDGSVSPTRRAFDPEEYHSAKKRLRKAVVEHYRVIELLHNYRILNITGFRKALKKFEKVTGIPAQRAYMSEKVDTSVFASGHSLRGMMKEMETLFISLFARGNRKIAMAYLRGVNAHKTHHFSSFRSGVLLGIAVPALVSGIYQSFQPERRASIVGWDGLLFVYGILFIPVVFALLVGVNLAIWSRSHINYVFIFELNPRTRLDYREYFEIPALLFSTLCYAFWLSFFEVGSPGLLPIRWPLVWLAFAFGVTFNPLNFGFRSSRYWLIRTVGRLLISGTRPVEFADFWMGDQFCSFAFTLSNIYLLACSYQSEFRDWQKCGSSSPRWPIAFCLAMLPSLIRLVQSIRRYADSRLGTHMINALFTTSPITFGAIKVSSHISADTMHRKLTFRTAARWQAQYPEFCGLLSVRDDKFRLYDLLGFPDGLVSPSPSRATYLIAQRNHLLEPCIRGSLVAHSGFPISRSSNIRSQMYYVAMVINVLIRFVWVIYIPSEGPSVYLRQFIAGLLEVIRRWQWNFYRLENEHIGNMDQYRVTREVPLPYSLDESQDGEDDDDE
ncbi:Xenotropic and polytropic retrovirus receptor 1 [Marasmius crinis-equi]|uniref:Xenotropic and polytropic retrovirus receptor 1 n=1 Tax=Marasmius crinis-equi TaxID=585013 RepID=A0ABR3FSD5_9AGAR